MFDPLNLQNDDFTVQVRLLRDPRGVLLIESPSEVHLKYSESRDNLLVEMAGQVESVKENRLKQLEVAEAQETELFAQLEKQRGSEFISFNFTFRTATIEDHDAADAEANKTEPRQELVYRRVLATRCLKSHDYPDFQGFNKLRTDVALYVFRAVSSRLSFSSDIRSFLLPPDELSVAG